MKWTEIYTWIKKYAKLVFGILFIISAITGIIASFTGNEILWKISLFSAVFVIFSGISIFIYDWIKSKFE
jgi:uncharacterized membrane protein HdeD (DUF308 family)